jgi:hypothetical protein
MTANDQYEFMHNLKKMIKSVKESIDMYEVVSYEVDVDNNQTLLKVRHVLHKTSNDSIVISGIGLGNNKGIVSGYEVGDVLICLDLRGELIILTTIYNTMYSQKDTMVLPLQKELILKSAGGGQIKFTEEGGFEILNLNGEGIKMDKDDEITITAKYIDINRVS